MAKSSDRKGLFILLAVLFSPLLMLFIVLVRILSRDTSFESTPRANLRVPADKTTGNYCVSENFYIFKNYSI